MKTNENDKAILKLRKEIDNKKKAIASGSKFTPETNCVLVLNNKSYNLHVLTYDELVILLANLRMLQQGHHIDFSGGDLLLSGYEISKWITDIKNKCVNLDIKTEKARLQKLEDRLYLLLSLDKKVELELDDIKKMI